MSGGARGVWMRVRGWLPGVIISLVALVIVFRLARWEELRTAFQNVQPLPVAAAVVLTVISLWTRANGWRVLLDHRPTVSQSFFIINEGYLLNNLFPLRMGEVGRAVFMGQASGLGPLHVLSTIVIERAFDLAIAAGMLLSTLPLALGAEWARPFAVVTLGLVVLGLAGLYGMARFNERVQTFILKLGQRWAFVERWIVPRVASLLEGLRVLTRPSQFLAALFWIVISWVLWVAVHYVMLFTLVPQVPLWWPMFIDSVLALGVAVPSAPAALGVFEAAVVGALAVLGVDNSSALAYAILMHFINFAVTGIFGFIGLVKEGRSLGSLSAQLRAQEPRA
mgnify:FL=1